MAYKGFRMGRGLSLKTSIDVAVEDGLAVATGCAFDEIGALSSARGRQKANNDTAIGGTGSILRGFDGLAGASASALAKYRFFKRGAAVYTNTTTDPALSDATNLSATYTKSIGTLVPRVKGLTAPTWGSTSSLSGFTYGGYAYLADGSTTQRLSLTSSVSAGVNPTVTPQTWGLQSPGYHEVTGTDPLDPTSGSADVILTVTGGHGYAEGLTSAPAYPYNQNVEFVGFKTVGGIPESEINGLHSSYSGSGAVDVTVTTSGTTLNAGSNYSVTFGGQYEFMAIELIDCRGGGALPNLNSANWSTSITTAGDATHNCVQQITGNVANTSGYWRLRFTAPSGEYEVTEPLAYNATHTQVQTALRNLSLIGDGNEANSLSTAVVTAATTIKFTATTTATSSTNGGGSIGFIRQGPTLARTANSGGLVGGTYYYAYTFYNGVAESNFSAQIPIYATSGDSVTLTYVLNGPVGTTERRIYRTDVNGRQLYYIGKIEDTSTNTYTDTAKLAAGADYNANPGDEVSQYENPAAAQDKQSQKKGSSKRGIQEAAAKAKADKEKLREKLATNLGLLSDWTDHDPPPSDLKHVGLIGDTCFGISGSSLRFSQSGNVEHWPLANSITPGRNTSETLRAWVGFDRDVIMYTDNALYRLSQVGLSFEDSRFEEIESPVGLAGEWAVAALDGQQGHLFLTKAGIYLFDGMRVTCISNAIEPMFTDSTHAHYVHPDYMSQAVMVTSRDRMYLCYRHTGSAGVNEYVLLGDFEDPSNPNWSVTVFPYTSLWREKADNYIVGGDSSGYVYIHDIGYTDDGAATTWYFYTKEYPLNDETMTTFDEIVIDADFAGATTTIDAYTQTRSLTYYQASFTSTATGRQRLKFKLPQYFKGERIAVGITSSSTAQRRCFSIGFTYRALETEP